jgi:predicted secreted hydrolase
VVDVVDRIAADFPRSAIFIVTSTYLVLFVLLRSVVLPAKALVMNTLSITASFGALVWIFQDGNLSAVLGFRPLGFVETTQPVILFCVLFGLSMDYEVFLLSRMKEVYDRTGDNREAVVRGLERSGRIVTSAALIVVLVAGSFALAEIVLIKAVGLGVALAVALDATVVRALLVPSTMRLLGRWNWWLPARLERWIAARLPVVGGAAVANVAVLGPLAIAVLAGCSPDGRVLANPPAVDPPRPVPSPSRATLPDPQPVVLPRDDGPHQRLTEWWYYTGHLRSDADGEQTFGFEFVIFRGERGIFPVSWASHVAVTDETGDRFLYDQRSEIGPQVDADATTTGPRSRFDLAVRGGDPFARPDPSATDRPTRGPNAPAEPWTMRGGGGHDRLTARAEDFAIDLALDGSDSPLALHGGHGFIDYGAAGGSYYYSRTRMSASGTISLDDETFAVTGLAWFDHQWGDYVTLAAGGWDWFAVNLEDGTDVTIWSIRAPDRSVAFAFGTLVRADGTTRHLDADGFDVTETDRWTSPSSGATYPAGWEIDIPDEELTIALRPTVADQELDARATTAQIYWEGSQDVRARLGGWPLEGEAYVELTGYAP